MREFLRAEHAGKIVGKDIVLLARPGAQGGLRCTKAPCMFAVHSAARYLVITTWHAFDASA